MKWVILASTIIAGCVLLHGLALWMERRGWIYYKHSRPSRTALGNVFLEVQSILEPDKRHVIEARDEMRKESREQGDEGEEDIGNPSDGNS